MNIALLHDHVGISVTSGRLDSMIQWYADKLGFVVERRFEAHGTTFVFLVNGGVRIELLTGASAPTPPASDVLASMDPERLHHFCVAVADLDAAIAQLGADGVALIGGPMQVPDTGQRIAFITDPVGTVIELAEPAAARS